MSGGKCTHFLITGPPGIGKTTLVKNVLNNLQSKQIPCDGFYTEERRLGGHRVGFDIVTIKLNSRKPLAEYIGSQPKIDGPRVGRYVVDISNFENIARAVLCNTKETAHVLILDEIGKMECSSRFFQRLIRKLFLEPSTSVIVATVPREHNIKVLSEIAYLPNIEMVVVDKRIRDSLVDHLTNAIMNSFNKLKKQI